MTLTEKTNYFISNVQHYIADTVSAFVRGEKDESDLDLAHELLSVIEVFDGEYFDWTDLETHKTIDYYNSLCKFNVGGTQDIIGFKTYILSGGVIVAGELPAIYGRDIIDFASQVRAVVREMDHNELEDIKGSLEGFHVSEVMFNYLNNIINPTVQPLVSLNLSTVPALVGGYAEKGVNVTSVTMTPSATLNDGVLQTVTRYYKAGVLQQTLSLPSTMNSLYVMNATVNADTTYRVEGDFQVGGTKIANKVLQFVEPYWYGLTNEDLSNVGFRAAATKVLLPKPSSKSLTLSFTLPSGNTSESVPDLMQLMIPQSWGVPDKVTVNGFEVTDSWSNIGPYVYTGANSQTITYILFECSDITEGTFTFVFTWD